MIGYMYWQTECIEFINDAKKGMLKCLIVGLNPAPPSMGWDVVVVEPLQIADDSDSVQGRAHAEMTSQTPLPPTSSFWTHRNIQHQHQHESTVCFPKSRIVSPVLPINRSLSERRHGASLFSPSTPPFPHLSEASRQTKERRRIETCPETEVSIPSKAESVDILEIRLVEIIHFPFLFRPFASLRSTSNSQMQLVVRLG